MCGAGATTSAAQEIADTGCSLFNNYTRFIVEGWGEQILYDHALRSVNTPLLVQFLTAVPSRRGEKGPW